MARPRHYDHDRLRKAIIASARALLEEDGPSALTARALAAAVGTTPGTLYALFGNLGSVLLEVNRETFSDLAVAIDEVTVADPASRLSALAETYVGFMLERRSVWRGLFEGPRETETFPDWYGAMIDGLLDRIAAPLRDLGAGDAARPLAEQLFVSVHGVVALAAIGRLDIVSTQSPEVLARGTVRTMVLALRGDPDALS